MIHRFKRLGGITSSRTSGAAEEGKAHSIAMAKSTNAIRLYA
jgi:hypothetical protein